ncbi:MAG: hypothetical protein IT236_02675 [Bacteroidia bacterium]|nr:hypothetical protein [Bacteroidia bacterium]
MDDKERASCTTSYLKVYYDRLLIRSKKVIHYSDIVCIKAIPNYFRTAWFYEEGDVGHFTEIILRPNQKIIIAECEDYFIQAFEQYKGVKINCLLKIEDVTANYSRTTFFFASLIGERSPLRLTLWKE